MTELPTYHTPRWVKVVGIIALVLVLLVGIVLVAGAGGEHGPRRHVPSGGGAPSPASELDKSSGVGGPASGDQADRTVEVVTRDAMTFEPGQIDVTAGETVTFLVTNAGQVAHEFTLGDVQMQQEHADEMAQMDGVMTHDEPNSITLQPGETKPLTWRFGDAGAIEYACHQPGHYAAGMRGQITINVSPVGSEGHQP